MSKKERQAHYRDILPVFQEYYSVFAASDYYAVEIMYFLIHAGIRVPEDIWVMDLTTRRNVEMSCRSYHLSGRMCFCAREKQWSIWIG